MAGFQTIGDPCKQRGLGEPQQVADGGAGAFQKRRGRREQVGAVAEDSQFDQPLGRLVDQPGHVVGENLDGEPVAVRLRGLHEHRLAFGGGRLARDGGGLDAGEQGVDRLADQGAAEVRSKLAERALGQGAERLIDLAQHSHRRFVDEGRAVLGRDRGAEQAVGLQRCQHDP